MEADRLRQEEETKLKKKMNSKKAKEEAEKHHAVSAGDNYVNIIDRFKQSCVFSSLFL